MAVFRVIKDKENPYVMINKYALYDKNLSYKAKGILSYCLSRPDNWEFYEEEIASHSTDGLASIKTGLKELREKGYILRTRKRDELGKFKGYEYLIYEFPQQLEELSKSPKCDFPTLDNPTTENPTLEKPLLENRMLLNNELNNNDNKLNNELSNKERENRETHSQAIELTKYIDHLTSNIGTINLGAIKVAILKYGYEYTRLAVERAISNNKCNMAYINGILQNWSREGYPSLEKDKKDVNIKNSKFCNYEQNSFNPDKLQTLEKKLLGWENLE